MSRRYYQAPLIRTALYRQGTRAHWEDMMNNAPRRLWLSILHAWEAHHDHE